MHPPHLPPILRTPIPLRPFIRTRILSIPSVLARHYANVKQQSGKSWTKKKPTAKVIPGSGNPFFVRNVGTDPRISLARKMLFSQKPLRGIHLNPQDQLRHETIHRAWLLFQAKRKRGRMNRLELLEMNVRRTLQVLRETDRKLYDAAVAGTREVERRFPLVTRIPTDTLPSTGWNYKWTPMNIKGVGGVTQAG
jgi:hypothetical protein